MKPDTIIALLEHGLERAEDSGQAAEKAPARPLAKPAETPSAR